MVISIVVPCFNEENNLDIFYNTIKKTMINFWDNIELIFINDGSSDNTFYKLEQIYNEDKKHVKVINFSRNFGKEAALLAGLKKSVGDYVSIIDADLQQNPKYLTKMIEFLESNKDYDMVAAYQQMRKEGKVLTFFKNSFYNLINRISEIEFVKSASDFRTLRRNVVDSIIQLPERCRFSKGIFSWVGFKTHYIEYEVEDRNSGESKWSFWKLFTYALNGIISFSDLPLKISSFTGIILCMIAFIYMIIIVIKTLIFGEAVAGFPTLICVILLTSGLQMFFMGILGQYVARTFTETKNRPIYIVKSSLD
ncbi:glycosyltransferase family 2 protein [Clostridium sp. NSJ-49]|uniref:glycosyltransferase family 2 protein n=1 Tax=Clostridium TaxID=1485 RepID=UPI00164C2667|nr:glycosyltransferase family 2 protein [Clostridium sp. NSJ-49]MBC5625937.1 glycosyltransferase family 2 protein [Clostridium sp. NSJ-49]